MSTDQTETAALTVDEAPGAPTRPTKRDWWRRSPTPEPAPAAQPAAPTQPTGPVRGGGRLPDWRTGQTVDLSAPPTPQAEDETSTEQAPTEPQKTIRKNNADADNQDDGQQEADAPEDNENEDENDAHQPGRLARLYRTIVPATDTESTFPNRARHPRQSFVEWWAALKPEQKWILNNGAAAAVGAYSPWLLTGNADIGLPQLALSWMHSAAASSTSQATPVVLGAGILLLAAVTGGTAVGIALRFVHASRTLVRVTHWLLVRIPVASAALALGLYLS